VAGRVKPADDWVARTAAEVWAEGSVGGWVGFPRARRGISPSGPVHLGNLRELMIPHLVADEIRAGPPVTSCAPAACARLEPDSFVGPVIRTVFVVMAVTLRWLSSWAREGPAKPRTGGTTPLFPGRWPAAGGRPSVPATAARRPACASSPSPMPPRFSR
jgi:tRNA synthetases class I (K)